MQDSNPALQAAAETAFDLDANEIRGLGVLLEKAFTTPDAYPLSINAITAGCNQLTAREPVMKLAESEVEQAINSLAERRLVARREQAGARVAKYEHLVRLRHSLPPPAQAVLAILLLRGAQTAAELRQRCERLHRFDDVAAVEAVLELLADKYPPMATTLPRAPGSKEVRHVHLLGGTAAVEAMAAQQAAAPAGRSRIVELEQELRQLRAEFDALRNEFGTFRQQFD